MNFPLRHSITTLFGASITVSPIKFEYFVSVEVYAAFLVIVDRMRVILFFHRLLQHYRLASPAVRGTP